MITIDGSEGEGGGQILRTALALSRRFNRVGDVTWQVTVNPTVSCSRETNG
jgi:hypothetical protein